MNRIFKIGDRVREKVTFMTGTITNTYDKTRNVTMMGDDGKGYHYHQSYFTIYDLEVEQIEKEMDINKNIYNKLKNRIIINGQLVELYNSLIQLINDNLGDVTGEVKKKCLQIRGETLIKIENMEIEQQVINDGLIKCSNKNSILTKKLQSKLE